MTNPDFPDDILEKILCKKMLSDKKYLSAVSEVFDSRWFDKDKDLGLLAKMSIGYFRKYSSVPSSQILSAVIKKYCEKPGAASDCKSLMTALAEMNTFSFSAPDKVILDNLQIFIKKKSLYYSIFDNLNDIEKNLSIDKCLERFDKVNNIAFQEKDLGLDYFNKEDFEKHWDYIKNPAAKIPTGWTGFDKVTNGGFLKDGKSIYLFMGQAGLGKSVFLSNLAVNWLKQNKSVIVISLEMSENVYAQRFDGHISGNNINRLSNDSEKTLSRIQEFYQKYPNADLHLKEYPPRTVRPSDIEAYLDSLKEAGVRIDAIIIDYLNLVKPQHSTDSLYKDVLTIIEDLRAISYKYSAPVVTATQTNTEGMNNENLGMQNASESRGIAFTADFFVALYQMPEDQENGIINCRILKNRFGGEVGKVLQMQLNKDNLILYDLSIDSPQLAVNNNADIQDDSSSSISGIDAVNSEINSI